MKNRITVIRVALWRFVRRIEKRVMRRQRITLAIARHRGRFTSLGRLDRASSDRWLRHTDRLLAVNARWFSPNTP